MSPGSAGGTARAKALSTAERRTIARKAAVTRWSNSGGASKPVSAAKLRRQIETNIAAIRRRAAELRRLAGVALDAVKDADAVIAVLEQAAGMLPKGE